MVMQSSLIQWHHPADWVRQMVSQQPPMGRQAVGWRRGERRTGSELMQRHRQLRCRQLQTCSASSGGSRSSRTGADVPCAVRRRPVGLGGQNEPRHLLRFYSRPLTLQCRTGRDRRLCHRYYEGSDATGADPAQELEAALSQHPATSAWRRAAALLVRNGELACWRALSQEWLASPDVEQQVADMLACRQ